MGKEFGQSWKKQHPGTFFGNSVEKADRAVKQAMSHPEEMAIEHAFNAIERAENAFVNAKQYNEELDTIEQDKGHLDVIRQQLNEARMKNGE
ncbi:hypothetical protein SporoP37_04945 [Sporosarcina sp. P37]|uniref:DUF2564 family protein n=1 Tax=unclassified Sporosarcina TaxID=2647733 RepID=UPI000A17BED8|nr:MULTISPECIES: DUF2564 family protein [unclassified Sporosarcina]ARK24092.1 hypothetical protein SporoP37_04945 [Sporosarcina sp. P37]PID18515.1 hypothetical protein CSV62_07635 [Sporosarcina sp. P35]